MNISRLLPHPVEICRITKPGSENIKLAYTEQQMLDFGRLMLERCSKLCDDTAADYFKAARTAETYQAVQFRAYVMALTDMAKEIRAIAATKPESGT